MKNEETIKFFTDEELRSFFKALERNTYLSETSFRKKCAIRNEAMFKLLYYCALRVSETTLLQRENYNDLKKEVYCKRLKGGINNTLRIIDEDIIRALKVHLKENNPQGPLFQNLITNKPLSRKTLYVIFQKTCEEAHIENKDKWHNHTLRHTRAINLAEKGFDLKELQYWLGHSDVSNTLIYFQFTAKQQEAMYQKLQKSKRRKK